MAELRNFVIIAHVDHGKSTLADRFLELTGTVAPGKMREQYLDQMELERERGITIKLQPVRMAYNASGTPYILNLIDTPGHADFGYEVSRSLACVESAILIVDAAQGIQAQTLFNLRAAQEAGLTIVPAMNKIDLKEARPDEVELELHKLLPDVAVSRISAKDGTGCRELLERVIAETPAPPLADKPLRALIFDSIYDSYRGIILYVRVVEGTLAQGDELMLMAKRRTIKALEAGYFKPQRVSAPQLQSGEIGFITTDLKSIDEARIGDTITSAARPAAEPLAGYKEPVSYVFSSFYPVSHEEFKKLKTALERLKLNDAALTFEAEHSPALGFGFRLGFLGMLHLEIVKERLVREFGLELIATTPSVSFTVTKTNGSTMVVKNPAALPPPPELAAIEEPWAEVTIVAPASYVGQIMQLSEDYRGIFKDLTYLQDDVALFTYELPLRLMIVDFYDRLKSVTQGYGSMNYEVLPSRAGELVKLDVLVAGELVEPFSKIVARDEVEREGRRVVERLKDLLPRRQFAVSLQAAVGGTIVAREDIPALRKDVTAKLYGGDVTRKRKLLEKQKKGKSRLKQFGQVEIPSDVFIRLLKG